MGESGKIKVSVVMPVYNTAEFVEESMRSILNQTLRELEFIVVDDGSTDGSLEVVQRIAAQDSRVQVLTQANSGVSVARNRGFAQISGEYTYFMDSDDILVEDALEVCYEKCRLDDLDFVFFDADIFYSDYEGQPFKANFYHRTHRFEDKTYKGIDLLEQQIRAINFSATLWLNLIKTDFIRRAKLECPTELRCHEDQLFAAKMYLQAENVGVVKRSLFRRRIRPNSLITSNARLDVMKGYFVVADRLNDFARSSSPRVKSVVDLFNRVTLNAALVCCQDLSFGDKIDFSATYVCRYPRYINAKSFVVMFLGKQINKLRRR